MLAVYKTLDGELKTDSLADLKGSWVNLVAPSDEEIQRVADAAGVSPDLLRAALDDEERPRLEIDDGQLLLLTNIPAEAKDASPLVYDTLPLAIIAKEDLVVTVCLQETPILEELVKTRQVATFMKTRFVLQILLQTAQLYLRYLRNIDRMSSRIEAEVHGAMRNEQVIKLFNLEKSLVYFTTSLRSNGIVFDKLFRSKLAKGDPELETTSRLLRMYPDDEDLLEDVITENRQALEMGETHSVILSGMLDAFASLVSNNLNVVMKFLTSVTIVMALPTMVASFFGMNVALPFARHPQAFGIVLGISIALAGVVALLMARRRMF